MIRLLTVICRRCGRPHVATFIAVRRHTQCPFCGSQQPPRVTECQPTTSAPADQLAA